MIGGVVQLLLLPYPSPQMCFCILWPFGHDDWQYYSDLELIYPRYETRHTLSSYLYEFLSPLGDLTSTLTNAALRSVLYCRTRGPSAYPFLIVHLQPLAFCARPVVLKLQGLDGPPEEKWGAYDNSTVTVAGPGQSARALAGRRYDVCHTMQCREAGIVDLLALAELATEENCSRAGYPATLFVALEALFLHGTVESSSKSRARAAPLPSDVAGETTGAIVETFAARRLRMGEQIIKHKEIRVFGEYDRLKRTMDRLAAC
ncbi:hypothetical protein C8R44DRAFT_882015 [Mycena epipterygia]|nr:hypothetical protein C8R44DRAFT_882015 [Mycena epipterygia]